MIRVFEAFSGMGAQVAALRNIGIPYQSVGISEIDKNAIKAYNAIHGETKNFGDITKIDPATLPDFDLFTYSFPCTDISNIGLQKGLMGTRSGLLYECKKIIEALARLAGDDGKNPFVFIVNYLKANIDDIKETYQSK